MVPLDKLSEQNADISTGSSQRVEDDERTVQFEQTILSVSECFVYKVPALRSASGHRAEDWNLAVPMFTGALRMYQSDLKMRVAIFTYNDQKTLSMADENLTLFGECVIDVKPGGDIISFVDGVIDSSRYYVLRLQDRASSRSVLIGIGFRERDTAFDFKNALNDYVRYIDRMSTADKAKVMRNEAMNQSGAGSASTTHGSTEKNEVAVSLAQHRDLSIPDGQKITIKSKLLRNTGASQTSTTSSSTPKTIALKPPPTAKVYQPINDSALSDQGNIESNGAKAEEDGEEEWGDFGSA